jgi:predicted  nucleic acid-binding Zn-ribbon protein
MATTKKTAKVVPAPMDERETFVSLQKSFAETEQSTQEKLKVLYELQAADVAIDELVLQRGELPAEVAVLEEELAGLKAKTDRIGELIDGYNQTIEAANKQIVELDAEIEKYRSQLENISNSREFDSINKELENQGLLRAIAEKNIGEARQAIEDRKLDRERIADRILIREEDLKAKQEELATIVESTAKEEKALQAKRAACAAKIDERTLSAYERIRGNAHNHLAVVTLFPKNEDGTYGDACGGCFHTITPQRIIDIASGKKLVICEHCGRIIVNPDI